MSSCKFTEAQWEARVKRARKWLAGLQPEKKERVEQIIQANKLKKEDVFFKIAGWAAETVAQAKHVERDIDTWCDGQKIRQLRAYKYFMDAFEVVSEAVAETVPADGRCIKDAKLVERAVRVFEARGRDLFKQLKKECPKGSWSWQFRPEGHVQLTCNGQEMPPSVRNWMQSNDGGREKTVFCRVPGLVSTLMSAGGDLLDNAGFDRAAFAMKLVSWAGEPDATRVFQPEMKLKNDFAVKVVEGPFVGVARKKKKKEQEHTPSGRVLRIAAAIFQTLANGARFALQCAVAAGRSIAYLVRLTMNVVTAHIKHVLMLAAAGLATYALWAPIGALISYGRVFAQLLVDPTAWIGAAVIVAAKAEKAFGKAFAVDLYKNIVAVLPILSHVVSLLAPVITRAKSVLSFPASAVMEMRRIGAGLLDGKPVYSSLQLPEFQLFPDLQALPTSMPVIADLTAPPTTPATYAIAHAAMESKDLSLALGSVLDVTAPSLAQVIAVASAASCIAGVPTQCALPVAKALLKLQGHNIERFSNWIGFDVGSAIDNAFRVAAALSVYSALQAFVEEAGPGLIEAVNDLLAGDTGLVEASKTFATDAASAVASAAASVTNGRVLRGAAKRALARMKVIAEHGNLIGGDSDPRIAEYMLNMFGE